MLVERMKLLVLNWQCIRNPYAGGAEVHLQEIFQRLVAQGHSVTLYCCTFPGCKREEEINGIHIIREGPRNFFNYYVPYRYHTRFRYEKYDCVIDDINKIPFYTPLYVKEPLVGIVHHLFGKSIFAEVSLPAGLYVITAERLAFPIYRSIPIAVVSESTRNEMIAKRFKPENLHIVPNAVDTSLYRTLSIPKNETPLIGYLGRLKKYKSVDHLLRAFQRVLTTIPTAHLVIIGDGDMKHELQALATSLGIDRSVTFTGFISNEEKVHWLNKMHVVVNPSAKEGWGLTVIEANACGTPVIASDVPGLRDSIVHRKTGLLYPYGSIEHLTEALLLLLQNETLRAELCDAARAWAEQFQWDRSASAMLALIESTVERSR